MLEVFICDICNKEFKSKRSLSSHKKHHNPEYKKRALEGSKALQTDKAKKAREKTFEEKKLSSWKKRNNKCIICNKKLEYPQEKTCSDSCYKQYRSNANSRIMTEEKRNAIKKGVQRYFKSKPPKPPKPPVTNNCKICKKSFTTMKNEKYCSNSCKETAKKQTNEKISKSVKLAFKEGRHLGNAYRNRKNKSYLEKSFIDYIAKEFPFVKYEFNYIVKILDENNNYKKCFYIDFYFPNQNIGIELDGKQHEYTKEYDEIRDNLIYETQKTKIIRVTYEEFFSQTRKQEIDDILKNEK
jgi:very-short-patch-repair endonuclease